MNKYGPVTDANALGTAELFDRAKARIIQMYRETGITAALLGTFGTYEAMINRSAAIAAEKAVSA